MNPDCDLDGRGRAGPGGRGPGAADRGTAPAAVKRLELVLRQAAGERCAAAGSLSGGFAGRTVAVSYSSHSPLPPLFLTPVVVCLWRESGPAPVFVLPHEVTLVESPVPPSRGALLWRAGRLGTRL